MPIAKKLLTAMLCIFLCSCANGAESAVNTLAVDLYAENIQKETDIAISEIEMETTAAFIPAYAELLLNTENLDTAIDAVCEKYYVNGMSVAVFANGNVIYTKSFGYADKEAGIKANVNTKYRVASVSKTITAVTAMTLVDSGLLDLDMPVSDVLGFICEADALNPNTARNLMTHTSTVVDSLAFDNGILAKPPLSLEQILKTGVYRSGKPGDVYGYSNYGFGITSAIIESLTGERFYEYAEKAVFEPLGIDAAYLRSRIKDTDNIANIYSGGSLAYNVKTWGRTEDFYDQIPIGQQYGLGQCELIISAVDLAKLGIIISGDGSVDGVNLLSKESVSEMNKVFITAEANGYKTSYGLGLRMSGDIVDGRVITGHPGNALGTISGLYFDSTDGTGVAVLTNGCSAETNEAGIYKINNDIINTVYDYFFNV